MKKATTHFYPIFFTLILVLGFTQANAQTTLINKNDTWTYLNDGTNQGTSWRDSGFSTTGWSSASGIFGRGTLTGATITTTLSNYLTTYFRKEITLTGHTNGTIDLNLLIDDGCVIYINGKEAYRDNLPSGTITSSTGAVTAVGGADEGDYELVTITDTFLIDGVNTIAVELHNTSTSSSDLGFDLEVTATEAVDSSLYVIFKNAEWNYLDNGSNQGTTWIDSGFNDASWSSGYGPLGYGTLDGASVTTTVSYGSNSSDKYVTTYFRKEVTLSNPDYLQLQLNLLADDAAAVYINGVFAFETGLPSGYDFESYATMTASGSDEGDYDSYTVPGSMLVDGVNTFAVEMHQVNATSSDLGFDLEVYGVKGKIVNGQIFMDLDGNATLTGFDTWGSGAIEIRAYNDADSNGVYTTSELVASELTDPWGNYSLIIDDAVRHLAVKLCTEDMDDLVKFTTDTTVTYTITGATSDTITTNFGQLGPRSLCFLIADDQNNNDEYYLANRISGKQKFVSTMTTTLVEALAIRVGMDSIWAFDDGQFGSVDIATGEFTSIGSGVGYGTGLIGGSSAGYTFTDIDGLAYDGNNDILYGVERRSGANDLLVAINRSTGDLIDGFFGSAREFLEITGTGIMQDVDDIAFDPNTGMLLAVNNQNSGDSTRYISINPSTGVGTVISIVGVGDFEGLGYYNTGELYGTTGVEGKPGYAANSFYRIDRTTGVGTHLDSLSEGGIDVEACDCLTGPTDNLISGVVFYDNDSSGTYNANIDTAYGDVKVYLYKDINGNGIVDAGDLIIDSALTNATTGLYVFKVDTIGSFLTSPYIDPTPFFTMNTTTDDSLLEGATFYMLGDYDGNNDFGFHISAGAPYLPVEFVKVAAKWDDDNAIVEWTTASEINVSHYVVERSEDAENFEPIGTVMAYGNSIETMDYEFLDAEASYIDAVELYYRVQEVDYDGYTDYSSIVSLTPEKDFTLNTYPNPIADYVKINYDGRGDYQLTITDITGNTLVELHGTKVNERTAIRIDGLNQLKSGIYFIHVSRDGLDSVTKILK